MAEQKNELAARQVVRYSNQQAKRISRECIETALMQLLEQKPFGEITISAIVQRAGVSRTAFYRNYLSKEDVLHAALEDAIEEIARAVETEPCAEGFWEKLFAEAEGCLKPLRLLLKAGMGALVLEQLTGHLLARSGDQPDAGRYNDILWAGAVYNILVHWAGQDAAKPAAEMAAICRQAVASDPIFGQSGGTGPA